jgi:hypothetical protein
MKEEPREVPQSVLEYNQQFANCLEAIKRRHDPVVSTVGGYGVFIERRWLGVDEMLLPQRKGFWS